MKSYAEKVGSCNYPASITRPDIAYTTSKLSEHLQNPGPQHFTAVDRCLAYLNFTRFKALEYNSKPAEKPTFETATDAQVNPNSDTATNAQVNPNSDTATNA